MTQKKLKIVHYLNQFFGQIGGEDKADVGFSVREEPVGPGMALRNALGDKAEIVATVICGDNYYSRDLKGASAEGLGLVEKYQPDLFFAGPAFAAGRYGVACGSMCKAVGENLGIPVVTGMFEENPGVAMYQKYAYIIKTGNSARGMVEAVGKMAKLGLKLVSGELNEHLILDEVRPRPQDYDYFSRIVIRNEYTEKSTAERSVDLLLAKLKGEPFASDVVMPVFERIDPPAAIKDLSKIELGLVSDGGLVPKGNPDGFSGRGNLRWSTYEIADFLPEDYSKVDYEIVHTGYFPVEVLENPNRLVPVDAIREQVAAGKVGTLHPTFFSTSGNATVSRGCTDMGAEIAAELKKREVDAVILTST
jgi:glycine reductase complex component B subunit gamma